MFGLMSLSLEIGSNHKIDNLNETVEEREKSRKITRMREKKNFFFSFCFFPLLVFISCFDHDVQKR